MSSPLEIQLPIPFYICPMLVLIMFGKILNDEMTKVIDSLKTKEYFVSGRHLAWI